MSSDPDQLLSIPGPSTIEPDIQINRLNHCKVIAGASTVPLGTQRMFYSDDAGDTWRETTLPLWPDDYYQRHISVARNSDQTAWALTVGTSSRSSPFASGTRHLRLYKSTDFGATWIRQNGEDGQDLFSVDSDTDIEWARMSIDPYPTADWPNKIWIIWSNNTVHLRSRNYSGIWETAGYLN
jgi:hypothetical protein